MLLIICAYNLCARNFKTLDKVFGNIASPMSFPKTHAPSGIILNAFKHKWEPVVLLNPQYSKNTLPPPFEAFGDDTIWKLHECEIKHEGECYEFTMLEAKKSHEKSGRLLKQFNLLFGVTRNKKFAAELRAQKKLEKEEEEKEEEEESESETETESESESETESDSSDSDICDSESEEEEEPEKAEVS